MPQGRRKATTLVPGGANLIDAWVGHRIRMRRTILGLSQTDLADQIGVTFQQIQKYERGANRVSGSRIYDLARVLGVEIAWFFADMPQDIAEQSPRLISEAPASSLRRDAAGAADIFHDPIFRRETLEFVRAYGAIPDAAVRGRLRALVMSLAKAMDDEDVEVSDQPETAASSGKTMPPARRRS